MLRYQLLRPFAFQKIEHEQLKPILVSIPWGITIPSAIFVMILPVQPPVVGDGSLSAYILGFMSILPGFYIAALSAISTFNREELDFTMDAPAPKLELRTGAETAKVDLTMRMFLSHMFSYLTAMSFLTVFICIAGNIVGPSIAHWVTLLPQGWWIAILAFALKATYLTTIIWLVAKIITVTLMGLYFLAERIHRPNA